jgi:predicted molibdopterin-dependent oxidoreductase YjgC
MTRSSSFRRVEIPPGEQVRFTCDGDEVVAASSDTVASALLAVSRSTFLTSPHDGAPRGGFCFTGRCSDCLMVIDGQPGTMACITRVRAGMVVETQTGLGHWDMVTAS